MTLGSKILRCAWLLCLLLPALDGVCSPAAQQQDPPTVDLENQPNTYQYPRPPRRRSVARPPQPQNSDPAPDPNANSAGQPAINNNIPANQTNPPSNNPALRPGQQTNGMRVPPSSTQAIKQPVTNVAPTPVTPPMQSSRILIGPPAPVAPTPEQMPPSAPVITYQDGLLSVESTNSKLSDILNGIRARTGIQFEGAGSASDRVAGKFGPAPANEVLTSLFQGSRFDYVIVGSAENPDAVQRVILTPTGGALAGGTQPPPAVRQQPSGDEDESAEEPSVETQPAPVPQQTGQVSAPVTGPKTTEQMLEELKQMQAKNANQQGNAGQTNPTGPNQMPPAPMKRPITPQ